MKIVKGKKKLTQKQKDQNYKMFLKHRRFLDKTRIKASDSFDKYLLTFATGSFYLSIFFTNNLPNGIKENFPLMTGWLFLLISIISTILSILFSVFAHDEAIDNIDLEINALLDNKKTIRGKKDCWPKTIDVLQVVSVISFILGITFLSIFYFTNLKNGSYYEKPPIRFKKRFR